MPRLGTGGTPRGDSGSGTPRRPAATAYPSTGRGSIFSNILLLLAFTFILRNLFFNDYRSEEIKILEASGKSKEEIEKIVPKTAAERRAYFREKQTEYFLMKKDIETLKEQVNELRVQAGLEMTSPVENGVESNSENEVDKSQNGATETEEDEEEEQVEEEEEEEQREEEDEAGEQDTTERRAKATAKRQKLKPKSTQHHHDHQSDAEAKTGSADKTKHLVKSNNGSTLRRKKIKTTGAAKTTAVKKEATTLKRKKKRKFAQQ